jgi:nucleotide-binding universal stress UspA family protein
MKAATAVASRSRDIKDILFLTDCSEPSEAAMPFAIALAREYGGTVHALHVQMPEFYAYSTPEGAAVLRQTEGEIARNLARDIDTSLSGVPHDVTVTRDIGVWSAAEDVIRNSAPDLIVLGTHGRTGPRRLVLGSVAEEILRRSDVPVLTVGPYVNSETTPTARFSSILFPTDFTAESLAAEPFAVSFAARNHGRLIVYHAVPEARDEHSADGMTMRINRAKLDLECVAREGTAGCERHVIVGCGEPAEQILKAADENCVDLIVLGVRDVSGPTGLATRISRAVANKVIANARCPVLTVRA